MPRYRKLKSVVHHGTKFKIGEACLINPDTNSSLPFIGKIIDITQSGSHDDDIAVKVVWYYRPEEALGGRKAFHGDKELFESDHKDEIHKNTIIGKCFVHSLKNYEELQQIGEHDFFTRFMYKPGKKEFEPEKVPVYCQCEQPYNPDKSMVMCELCQDWFHPSCIGISPEVLQTLERDTFCCPLCSKTATQATKRARIDPV